jgi:pilus assembly protein Flp/PilA
MLKLFTRYQLWSASDEGATAVEYGILVALIAAAIIVIVGVLGIQIQTAFKDVSDKIGVALP